MIFESGQIYQNKHAIASILSVDGDWVKYDIRYFVGVNTVDYKESYALIHRVFMEEFLNRHEFNLITVKDEEII
jgi:hypothetical protein